MKLIEIASFPASGLKLNGTETQVIPFIGVEIGITGEKAGTERAGIGIKGNNGLSYYQFSGDSGPLQVVRSYRAIKFLREEVKNIQPGTVRACFSIALEHPEPNYFHDGSITASDLMHFAIPIGRGRLDHLRKKGIYIPHIYGADEDLVSYILAAEEFEQTRKEILTSVPASEQLENIISSAQGNNVAVCIDELKREVELGRLVATPKIEVLLGATCSQARLSDPGF